MQTKELQETYSTTGFPKTNYLKKYYEEKVSDVLAL